MTSDYNNLIYDTSKNETKSMKYLLTNYKSPITETKYVDGKIITTEYGQNVNTTNNYTSNEISSTEYDQVINSTSNYTSNPILSNEYGLNINKTNSYTSKLISSTEFGQNINKTNNYTSNDLSSNDYGKNINSDNNKYTSDPILSTDDYDQNINSDNNYISNLISSAEYDQNINSTSNHNSNPISSTEYGQNINSTSNYNSNPISSNEYAQNINSTNNYTSNPISSYTYTLNEKNTQSSLEKAKNKTIEYYSTDPLRMSYELNDVQASATNKTNDIFSYKTNNKEQIIYPTTYKTVNKYRSRSPGITRSNNYLLNYGEATPNKTTNYSRSPGPSIKYKNNIYSTTPIRYVQYKYVTPSLLYPNNLNNIKYVPVNNELVQTYYVTNNVPAYASSNIRYYASNPVTPTNKNFLNTVTSGTYQTIPISSPLLNSSTNYYNYNSKNSNYITSIPKFSTTVYGKNTANSLLTPAKSNNQINSASNINSFPTSYKSNQTNSFMPNSYEISSNPSTRGINFNNYNSLSSKKGENNSGRNQYDGMVNPLFYSEDKNSPLNEISNFDKNKITHLCSEEKDNISSSANFKKIVKKNLKNFDNSSHNSGSEDASSSGIATILYSNGKKYFKKKLENKIDASDDNDNDNDEEANTNVNKLNNNIKNDKVSTFSNSNDSSYSFDNSNQKYLYRQTQIKNYPSDYFSQYMFEHINQIRNNPKKFIQLIKESISNIGYNKKGNLIYIGDLKVALCKGKIAFEEAIDSLNNTEPMNSLIFKGELCVDIPQKEKYFKSGDYLRKEIREKVKNGIIIRAFWRDIIKDPKINFLLMIVDDNPIKRGDKRKDILDPKMKYIGINSGTLGNSFVCYTVLSNE